MVQVKKVTHCDVIFTMITVFCKKRYDCGIMCDVDTKLLRMYVAAMVKLQSIITPIYVHYHNYESYRYIAKYMYIH